MKNTFTERVSEEISHHIGKVKVVDEARLSYDKLEVKKDLRLKFLKCGVVYEPTHGYHLEYRFKSVAEANDTLKELISFDIDAKLSIDDRRNYAIIYIVDANTIMETLNILGAGLSLKYYKKVVDNKKKRGDTNRIVNFETANIKKTANAILKQLDDIKKLLKKYDIRALDTDLKIVIRARNKYKSLNMSELAKKIGISKSALNHRFIRIRKMGE